MYDCKSPPLDDFVCISWCFNLKVLLLSKTLDLTWLPPFIPEQNGKIVGYEVKYFLKNGEKKLVKNVTLNADDYTTILRNLHPGQTYCIKIAARTKAGLGPYSKEVSGVVLSSTTKGWWCLKFSYLIHY